MKCVIPYIHSFNGQELRYCLRGIEKYVDNPEVILIGHKPSWIKNIEFIPYPEGRGYVWKEKNIYEKLCLVKDDFIYFNDDHYLLEAFNFEYHYSGTLGDIFEEYVLSNNPFSKTIYNTMKLWDSNAVWNKGRNYYRHQPFFIKETTLAAIRIGCGVDMQKEWGFCLKSVYAEIESQNEDFLTKQYPDLKIKTPQKQSNILKLIKGRPYFSTGEGGMNADMIKVLENIYPEKSKYE